MYGNKLDPVGFWSYSRQDDEHSGGRLSQLRARLSSELQINYGRDRVQIFQDSAAIPYGADWDGVIRDALNRSTFFIPILTPNFIQSEFCLHEVEVFLERERALHAAHPDLAAHRRIFPILYIPIQGKEAREPAVVAELEQVQWLPFEKLRHLDYDQPGVRQTVSEFAATICELLDRRTETPIVRPVSTIAARITADPEPSREPEPVVIAEPEPEPLAALAEPVADRAELIRYGVLVSGLTALLAIIPWLATLGDRRGERLVFAGLIMCLALAAFAGTLTSRRLFDHGWPNGGRRRLLLHSLLATGLSIAASIVAAMIYLSAISYLVDNSSVDWLIIAGALFVSVAAAALFFPANIAAAPLLSRLPGRALPLGLGAFALAAAAALYFGVLQKSPEQEQQDLIALMARKGELSALTEDGTAPAPESIKASQKRLGHPETGTVDAVFLASLEALPDRQEWEVSPEDDLLDVILRAGYAGQQTGLNRQTITLAPGVYRIPPPGPSGERGLTFTGARIALRGTGMPAETVVTIPADSHYVVMDDDIFENLTFKHEGSGGGSLFSTTSLYGSSGAEKPVVTLRNVVIEARSTTSALVVSAQPGDAVLLDNVAIRNPDGTALSIEGSLPGADSDLPPAKVDVINSSFSGKASAVVVGQNAAPTFENNRIGPVANGAGVYVIGLAKGVYRGNRFGDTGDYSAFGASDQARPVFENNIVSGPGECLYADKQAVLTARDNTFSGCYGGRADGESEVILSGNKGLPTDTITVSVKAKLTAAN